jgi:hypothetical protein
MTKINFVDQDSKQEGVATVRVTDEAVGLGLSLRRNGDIEVFLKPADIRRLVQALNKACGKIS